MKNLPAQRSFVASIAATMAAGMFLAVSAPTEAQAAPPAASMAHAARAFLQSLDDAQRQMAVFEFEDEERRNWHYIPKERNGLPLKEMDFVQRQLANALLASGLSGRGVSQALTIMTLEQVLWEMENQSPKRDPENYLVSIFGKPGDKKRWGWRVEGHHLSVNFTITGGKDVSATPNFFATNPAEVREGARKGLRVLAREEDLARKLVKSLDDGQKKKAVIEVDAPRDILTSAEPKVQTLGTAGLPASEMTEEQRAVLMALVTEYLHRASAEISWPKLKAIREGGMESILFAWAGGTEPGEGHYYRVQGATFLLEYINTQNDANHVHAVWREFDGDFGEDILRKHYAEFHAVD